MKETSTELVKSTLTYQCFNDRQSHDVCIEDKLKVKQKKRFKNIQSAISCQNKVATQVHVSVLKCFRQTGMKLSENSIKGPKDLYFFFFYITAHDPVPANLDSFLHNMATFCSNLDPLTRPIKGFLESFLHPVISKLGRM